MAENYDLIFGQSASQQYAWSDSDYQNGWQTVGSTPPTAEQFDALQRKSDTKAKDLNDRLSPLEEKAEADGRQAATTYTAGAMLTVDGLPNGWLLQCIVPGISGTDAITLPDTLIDGLTIIDGDVTWALRKVATNGGLGYRQPNTAYTAGQIAYHASLPTGYYLECTTAGTTSAGEITPSSTIGDTVTDGTVTWVVSKIYANAARPVLVDCDTAIEPGHYATNSSTVNAPTMDHYSIIVLNQQVGGYGDIVQMAVLCGYPSSNSVYSRVKHDSDTWGPWRQQDSIVAKSLGQNGYIKYASGLIIQWGSATYSQAGYVNRYPISFPTIAYRPVGVLNGEVALPVSLWQDNAQISVKEGFVGLSTSDNKGGSYVVFGY